MLTQLSIEIWFFVTQNTFGLILRDLKNHMGGGATHTVSLTVKRPNLDDKTFPLVFLIINTGNMAIMLNSLGKEPCIARLNLWVINKYFHWIVINKFFIGQWSISFLLDSDQQVLYWIVINKFFIGQWSISS